MLLAIETSSLNGSIALFDDQELVAEKNWTKSLSASSPQVHSENLTKNIESIFNEKNISSKDIKTIAVSIGPGSFTGIRVGINAARALAYAVQASVYTVDSLTLLAQSFLRKSNLNQVLDLTVVVNAYRNQLYYMQFQRSAADWTNSEPPKVANYDEIANKIAKGSILIGDGCELLKSNLSEDLQKTLQFYPNAYATAATLGNIAINQSKFQRWNEVVPLYIRKSEAEEKFSSKLK